MSYLDLHCHTFFKPIWLKGDPQKLLEGDISTKIDKNFKPGLGRVLLQAFGSKKLRLFDSQSSLKQIHQGNGTIVVINMVAMENSYANLSFCGFKSVFKRIENIQREQLVAVGTSQISYFDLLTKEVELAAEFANKPLKGVSYRLINSFDEIQDDAVINVLLAVEGGHCFYKIPSVLLQENPAHDMEVVEVLHDWKVKAKNKELPRLLYITLTHHTTNCLTNHAFAVPPSLAGAGKNNLAGGFNPTGNGLTDIGRAFIQTALRESDQESRVLIDIKHMSLRSRLDFYNFRRELIAAGHPDFPILATHMGVTGLSIEDAIVVPESGCRKFHQDDACFEVEYLDAECTNGFFVTTSLDPQIDIIKFNLWSLNLYDEDIREIVASGGLIGFCFDSRILGNEELARERFSKQERDPLLSIKSLNLNQEITLDTGEHVYGFENKRQFRESRYPEKTLLDIPTSNVDELKKQTDLLALCQNILHTVLVGGPKAWDCVCIGSDLDGMINSIDFVPNAASMPGMENQFRRFMNLMVNAMNAFLSEKNKPEERIQLPVDFYERIVLTNAKKFLKNHFN